MKVTMMSFGKTTTALVFASLAMFGCSTTASSEHADSTSQALGEPGCATEAITAFQVGMTGAVAGQTYWSDATLPGGGTNSAGVGYGSSSCPIQYVAEYDNLPSMPSPNFLVTTTSDFDENPNTNQADCTTSYLTLGVYAKVNGTWNTAPVTTTTYQGYWTGSNCDFGSMQVPFYPPANTTALRAAVSAYQNESVKGGTAQALSPVSVELNTYTPITPK